MNYFNEESIQIYLGEKRSGKTLVMVADTYEILKNVKNPPIVYANFELNKEYFPTFIRIDKNDMEGFYKQKESFKKCIFLVDEGHIFFDSRRFMKDGNVKLGYLIGQMGKRGNILKLNTHFPRLLDIRLRSYCEKYIYVSKVLYRNNKIMPVQNNNRIMSKEEENYYYVYCEPVIQKLANFNFQSIPMSPYLVKANKFFSFYDTEEMIVED